MELLFVLGFFVMLMLTGVSLLGVLAALAVATVVMVVGGLLMLVIHVLPWLLLAVAAVWLWRRWQGGAISPAAGGSRAEWNVVQITSSAFACALRRDNIFFTYVFCHTGSTKVN